MERHPWKVGAARIGIVALLLSLVSVTAAPPPTFAGPPKRNCPDMPGSAPGRQDLPGLNGQTSVPNPAPGRAYEYVHPEAFIDLTTEPTGAERDAITGPKSAYPKGSRERLIWQWNRYLAPRQKPHDDWVANGRVGKEPPLKDWERWSRMAVGNQGYDAQGSAYEDLLTSLYRLGGNFGWVCNAPIPGGDPDRIYDRVNEQLRVAIEAKSGEEQYKDDQLAKDKGNKAARPDWDILYWTALPIPATVRAAIAATGAIPVEIEAKGEPTRGSPSPDGGKKAAKPAPTKPTGPAGGVMTVPGQAPATGALTDAIADSPTSPEDAQDTRAALAELATDSDDPATDAYSPRQLGGVDFSTLELRYVSDPSKGKNGLQYSFRAKPTANGALSWGGLRAAQENSDAFFVWLAVPTTKFWVNLNPDEPDRIIDPELGRTDAGRVLLQADLQMKKTVAKLIHPDTQLGKKFWDSLQGMDSGSCLSFRQWIVPAPASVREDGDALYILDAPLTVKLESDYFAAKGAADQAGSCARSSKSIEQHNEQIFRSLILPRVQKAVNEAPEYEELRRVYLSRVAAEWYRQRNDGKPTAFGSIIESGSAARWPARTPWKPKDVFDQYVKSYTKGEFNVTHKTTHGNMIETRTYVFGGVDFSSSPRLGMSTAAFTGTWPDLPGQVSDSRAAPVLDGQDQVWLGGVSANHPRGAPTPAGVRAAALGILLLCALVSVGAVIALVTLLVVITRRRRGPPRPLPRPAGPMR